MQGKLTRHTIAARLRRLLYVSGPLLIFHSGKVSAGRFKKVMLAFKKQYEAYQVVSRHPD